MALQLRTYTILHHNCKNFREIFNVGIMNFITSVIKSKMILCIYLANVALFVEKSQGPKSDLFCKSGGLKQPQVGRDLLRSPSFLVLLNDLGFLRFGIA